jgi:hypothetical protein
VRGERPATNPRRQYTTSHVRERKFVEGKNVNLCLYIRITSHAEIHEQLLVFVSHQHWKAVNGRLHAPAALAPEENSGIH